MFTSILAKIKKYQAPIIVILFLVLANLAWFYKFYLFGLLPYPGDLLVSFFFPWNSGGFIGYDQWTTHKEVIAADVVRQMYPWKDFAFDLIRQGQLPLWNPHNFSGYPLISNLQSSVFFPGNFIFLILPNLWAWISLVLFLPTLITLFTYLFLRSLKLSPLPAIFGGIVAANLGYIIVWHEQLIITQVALFLPLILWMVNKYLESKKTYQLFLISLFIAFAIYAGHAQTFIYLAIMAAVYMLVKRMSILKIALVFVLGIAMAAPQLFPTMEVYLHSAREGQATRELFAPFVMPWGNIATIFAPDFFGSPAVGNFWGKQYGDFLAYFGVVAAFFSLVGVLNFWQKREIKTFFIMGTLGLLFALWPLVYIPHILNIPILASGVPARVLYIFQFSFAVLAAFGLQSMFERKFKKKDLLPIIIFVVAYMALWSFALLNKNFEGTVAKSNLILPTATFLLTAGLYLFIRIIYPKKFLLLLVSLFVFLSLFEYSYVFNKYQPFSKREFVFPNHPVTKFLQEKVGNDRYFGFGTAYVDSNFGTYYKVYAPEGWDSLYIKRYGELLASTDTGKFPKAIKRSDAIFGSKDYDFRNRLFDILGIKYILDKNDNPLSNWDEEPAKFPLEKYKLYWQNYKWKAYKRLTALPRAFLASNYEVVTNDKEIIRRLYDKDFNYKNTLILEENPNIKLGTSSGMAKITTYSPSKVVVETNSTSPKLLFLSDTFFPGWNAYVDGKLVKIYRADYVFRAVSIPTGQHKVVFVYDPLPFKAGVMISVGALIIWGFILIKKKIK